MTDPPREFREIKRGRPPMNFTRVFRENLLGRAPTPEQIKLVGGLIEALRTDERIALVLKPARDLNRPERGRKGRKGEGGRGNSAG